MNQELGSVSISEGGEESVIANLPINGSESCLVLLNYIRSRWWMSEHLIIVDGDTWNVSTGGMSDNETLIGGMMDNFLFWSLCWESSSKGGHYVFRIPKISA